MNASLPTRAARWRRRAFTLVELLIVIIILGVLASTVIAMVRSSTEDASRHTFVTSLRAHGNAFRLYHVRESAYPPDRTPAVYPAEMVGLLREEAWTADTTLGGQWDWDYGQFGFTAGVSVYQPDRTAAEMAEIDAIFDDGDLGTGAFRQRTDGYIHVIEF